jgi:hypothetical protein
MPPGGGPLEPLVTRGIACAHCHRLMFLLIHYEPSHHFHLMLSEKRDGALTGP